ncbi:MAG: RNA methyltransferase, partial [Limisphaerales bacterium]
SRFVKPGGKLVYATCSLLPDENERQIQGFLAERGAAWTLEQELHLRPDREGFDGFYAARLKRNA